MKKFLQSPYAWLAPALAALFIITIVPTFFLFFTSLHHWELGFPWDERVFIGLKNFSHTLQNPLFRSALVRTLIYTVSAVTVQFILGFLIASFLSRRTLLWRGFLIGSLIIPMTVTPSIAGLIWRLYFNPTYGIVNYLLGFINLQPNWYGYELALLSAVIVEVWQWTPFVTLILLAGLSALPRTPFEAAMVDGASRFQMLWNITLPLLRPIILIALLLRGMDALKMFDVIFSLTGGGPADATELISMLIYRTGFYHTGMVGRASAIAVFLLAAIILLSQFLIKILDSEPKSA
ncbi:MAG: sugar ABC transporter permease [Firmicutes bacterium]|nr:sugar ABC transporter permease [Bacillota bacterium]